MTTKYDPFDGTIEVRVVLHVKVDPKLWARDMMGEHPDEVLQREVRDHVKDWVVKSIDYCSHDSSAHSDMDSVPITEVILETPYRKEGR